LVLGVGERIVIAPHNVSNYPKDTPKDKKGSLSRASSAMVKFSVLNYNF